jgi:hypothetical protein
MLRKIVRPGEMIPRFYGAAWYDWLSDHAVCMPLGLNVLAAVGRTAYFTIKHAGRMVQSSPRDAYEQGFRAGRASVQADRAAVEPRNPW